jgi:cell division transport system ATP-binding protein
MKLIMREEKPTGGEIIVNGFKLNKLKRRQIPMLRRTMGIVFQDFRLIPNMNVYDNVAFSMHVVGASKQQIRRKVSHVLSVVGLSGKARSKPSELSGGEQQRVGLARALVNNPSLIIADEPTGNVDPNMSYEIVEMLTEINKMGTTVLMVTHEHQLVRDFNRRVIMLENGRVVADNADGGAK